MGKGLTLTDDDLNFLSNIKRNILQKKRELKLTYAELNEKAGLCNNGVQRVVNQGVAPQIVTLYRISKALNCNIDDLTK